MHDAGHSGRHSSDGTSGRACHRSGGTNLMRDPRNGRTFDYFSEDPLLSSILASNAIADKRSTSHRGWWRREPPGTTGQLFVIAMLFIFGAITSLSNIIAQKLKELFIFNYTPISVIISRLLKEIVSMRAKSLSGSIAGWPNSSNLRLSS